MAHSRIYISAHLVAVLVISCFCCTKSQSLKRHGITVAKMDSKLLSYLGGGEIDKTVGEWASRYKLRFWKPSRRLKYYICHLGRETLYYYTFKFVFSAILLSNLKKLHKAYLEYHIQHSKFYSCAPSCSCHQQIAQMHILKICEMLFLY